MTFKVDPVVDKLDTWSLACHALNHRWDYFSEDLLEVATDGTIRRLKLYWRCSLCDTIRADTIKLTPRRAHVEKRSYNRVEGYSPTVRRGKKRPTKDMYRAAYLKRELKEILG